MNDEIQQIREEIFIRIILGVVVIGLVTGLATIATSGLSSPWFIRAIGLLIVTTVAFTVQRLGRLAVASYILVLELVSLLVIEMFLYPGSSAGFAPYLLIPIVIIASFLLSPLATLAIAVGSILAILLIVAVADQLSLTNLIILLPSFGLILVVAFLVSENRRYTNKLGDLLRADRKLLKEQRLEMKETRQRVKDLQRQVTELENQQRRAKTEADQIRWLTTRREDRLYNLVRGIIQELNVSVEKLESVIEQFGEQANRNEDSNLLKAAWQRIDDLKALIVNLRQMALIEHGEVKLSYRAVDVGRLISEVVGATQGLARGKELKIRYQVPEDLPPVPADPVRLRQVLLHLLQNAIKYTDQGIIEMQAEVTNGELIIFISDTGIGIHREEAELIFKKFGRGSGTLAQQRQGTGLGLAISKRLIELHGGRMWVNSVLGIGSTFYLSLPLETTSEKTRAAVSVIEPGPVTATAGSAQPAPTPVAATETVDLDDAGATLVFPGSSPSPLPTDVETTILSKPQSRPVRHPSPPIQRSSPTYIRRFGFMLLGLLVVVVGIVTVLALIYGPVQQDDSAAATVTGPSLATGDVTSPTTPAKIAQVATGRPSATPKPAAMPLPTGTPTEVPPTAISIAISTATPTRQPTATSPPPTITTPEAPATPPNATSTSVAPTVVVQPDISVPQISFFTGWAGRQNISGFDFGDSSISNLVIESIDNNRLSWSPSGQLLFAGEQGGDRDIYVANRDDGQPVRLTTAAGDDLQPAWSPDGRKIAFSSGRTGNFEIYVMDADGSHLLQLTDSRGFDEWPAWSPDGRKIAFVSDRDGNVELYTMAADGSNQQRLTHHPADDWPAAWSPDGRWLVFASERDGDWNLYLIRAEGGPAMRLTNAPGAERDPIWAPDRQNIAFAYNGAGNWDIYTLPAPTGAIAEVPLAAWTQITNTPTDERYPAWPQ